MDSFNIMYMTKKQQQQLNKYITNNTINCQDIVNKMYDQYDIIELNYMALKIDNFNNALIDLKLLFKIVSTERFVGEFGTGMIDDVSATLTHEIMPLNITISSKISQKYYTSLCERIYKRTHDFQQATIDDIGLNAPKLEQLFNAHGELQLIVDKFIEDANNLQVNNELSILPYYDLYKNTVKNIQIDGLT